MVSSKGSVLIVLLEHDHLDPLIFSVSPCLGVCVRVLIGVVIRVNFIIYVLVKLTLWRSTLVAEKGVIV